MGGPAASQKMPKLLLGVALLIGLSMTSGVSACDAGAYATCIKNLGTVNVAKAADATYVCSYMQSYYKCYGDAGCCSDTAKAALKLVSDAYKAIIPDCTLTCTAAGGGGGGTPSPPAVTTQQVTQTLTYASLAIANYVTTLKSVFECAYLKTMNGWCTPGANNTFTITTGVTITSTASAARRAGTKVSFATNVKSTVAGSDALTTKAAAVTPATFGTAL